MQEKHTKCLYKNCEGNATNKNVVLNFAVSCCLEHYEMVELYKSDTLPHKMCPGCMRFLWKKLNSFDNKTVNCAYTPCSHAEGDFDRCYYKFLDYLTEKDARKAH